MASFALHCRYNISSTDSACKWSRPKPPVAQVPKRIENVYPIPSTNRVTDRPANVTRFLGNVQPFSVAFAWILRDNPNKDAIKLVPCIEEICLSQEFQDAPSKGDFLEETLKVNETTIRMVEEATKGQRSNANWLMIKKLRLTASNFGKIISAIKRGKYSKSLYHSLITQTNLDHVKAIQWGIENEKEGVRAFESQTGKKVLPSGLWLDECGFLGASPDGIIENEDAILEVKCPFKFRDEKMIFNDPKYLIYTNEDGLVVNKNNDYYHQIQGQLYITKKSLCYLVIWTPKSTDMFEIAKDVEWERNFSLLKTFYCTEFINKYIQP